jgi:hypothetical protein
VLRFPRRRSIPKNFTSGLPLTLPELAAAYTIETPIWVPVEPEQEAFGPETIAVLGVALEETLRQRGLIDCNDPAMTMVAKRIIELAKQGERDPIRLRDQTVRSFC